MMKTPVRNWFKRSESGRAQACRKTKREIAGWNRPRLEVLEDRTLMSVSIVNNGGNGYAALHFSQTQGYVPPDTNGAAGPTNYVETVNQTLAIFNPKDTGASSVTDTFSHFWFTTGGLPHADGGSGLSDPVVTYDNIIGKFVVADQDVNFSTHVSRFDVAVSTTSSPATLGTADWKFYSIVTTEAGHDADYPGNFGFNKDAVVFTLNMFGSPNRVQVISISSADLAAGSSTPAVFHNDLADFSVRPTTMHDAAPGDPMWLVTEHGDHHSIDVIKMGNVLSNSATFAYTNLGVTPYTSEVAPLNPNGTTVTTNIDARIQKSSLANHTLVAAHSVGVSSTQDAIDWYKIDVSSGTPVLSDQGRVGFGTKTYLTYPSIDINPSNQIGMTYMKQGNDTSTDFVSMYLTGRNPGDAAGTMETPVLVPSGTGVGNYHDFTGAGRSGDLGGINIDPNDGSFWAANEFANTDSTANWGTAVANFTLSSPLPSTDMQVTATGPSSVNAGSNAIYSITINNLGPNDALGVILSDLLPAGSTFVSIMQTSGSDMFTLGQSGSNVTETANGTITSGSSDSFDLTVFAPTNLANGAPFNDTASVSANNPDPNTANNTATVNGTVVNSNTNADLSATMTGKIAAPEGAIVKYTITINNAGPSFASGTVATDTLGALLKFVSATTTQGTFSQSGGVITFNIGSMAPGATVTLVVSAQALEDGSTSNSVSVTSSNPDPNLGNNSASKTTNFSEPSIVVSAPKTTTLQNLINFQAGNFSHANGVEPAGNFIATINWGDGTTSQGSITQVGKKYNVFGSHNYANAGAHTISISVVETGQAVDKVGDDNPGDDRFNHLPFTGNNPGAAFAQGGASVGANGTTGSVGASYQQQTTTNTHVSDQVFSNRGSGLGVGSEAESLVLSILGHERSNLAGDWIIDSLFAELGL
jgi:uncharacterized repeat protein (TIGR01451 family)